MPQTPSEIPIHPTRICVEYPNVSQGESRQVPFVFLSRDDVHVYIKHTETIEEISVKFDWISDGQVQAKEDIDSSFIIFRYTPRTNLTRIFNDDTSIRADDFNEVLTALLYAIQEGEEASDIVDELVNLGHLTQEVRDRLLPELPPLGQRDEKIAEFNGDDLVWTHANDSSLRLTGVEIGDQAFRNVPTDLTPTEKRAVSQATDINLRWRGQWAINTSYHIGDLVIHSLSGSTPSAFFYCKAEHISGLGDAGYEPYRGSNSASAWYTLGYSQGAPNSFINARIDSTNNRLLLTNRFGLITSLDLPGDDQAFISANFNNENSELTFTRGDSSTFSITLPDGTDITQQTIYPSLFSTLKHDKYLTITGNPTQHTLTVGINSINLQEAVIHSANQNGNLTTADRGKFLAISTTDQTKLRLASRPSFTPSQTNLYSAVGKIFIDGENTTVVEDETAKTIKIDVPDQTTVIQLNAEHKEVSVGTKTDSTFTNLLGSTDNYNANTVYFVTITDSDNDNVRSVAFEGQDFNGKTIRITGSQEVQFFSNNEKLDVRSNNRRAFTANITWYEGEEGSSSGGLSTVISDDTLSGTGASDDPLKVTVPFTGPEKLKLGGLTNYTLTDQKVLDLIDTSRESKDRGKLLGVSETDQDQLALFETPEAVGEAEEVQHLESLTNDIDLITETIEWETAPASEAQWTGYATSTGNGQRLAALADPKNKITDADLANFSSATWFTGNPINVDTVVILRIKPHFNPANFGVALGNKEADVHHSHTFRMIGSDRNWSYFLVDVIEPPNPGYTIFTRKRVATYTTAYHGNVDGPLRDYVNDVAESTVDLERVVDSNTRTLADADKAGWTEFSGGRIYANDPREITLNAAELEILQDRDTQWSTEGSQSHNTAAVVRLNRNTALPVNYVFVSTSEGSVRFWNHNYVGQDDNWNYFVPHKNTSQRGEGAKIEYVTETSHTIYHGKLGMEALDSIPPVINASGRLSWAFSNGMRWPVTSLRGDVIDQIFGNFTSAVGATVRLEARLLVEGVIPGLTSISQITNVRILGQTLRSNSALIPGEYIGGTAEIDSVLQGTGEFGLFATFTNSLLDAITQNISGESIRIEINYNLGDGAKIWRLTVPYLTAAQISMVPLSPYIPQSAIIGGVGISPVTGTAVVTQLPTTNIISGKTYFQVGNGVSGTASPGLYIRAGNGWRVISKTRTLIGTGINVDISANHTRLYATGITIPVMDDEDILYVKVVDGPGIEGEDETKQLKSWLWKTIRVLPKGESGVLRVNQERFITGDLIDGEPKYYLGLSNTNQLLIQTGHDGDTTIPRVEAYRG